MAATAQLCIACGCEAESHTHTHSELNFYHPLNMNSPHAFENVTEEVWTAARREAIKQVRRSVAKVPGGRVVHGGSQIPGSALAPAGGVESLATLSFHGGAEDGGCHPTAIGAHSAGVDV